MSMKKGKIAGIGIAVIAVAIVFGIASLPDEVLLETPIGASENIPTETLTTEFRQEIISSEEQTVETQPEEEAKPETQPEEEAKPETQPEEEEAELETEPEEEAKPETQPEEEEEAELETEPEEEAEGNVIKVKISDGVGGAER